MQPDVQSRVDNAAIEVGCAFFGTGRAVHCPWPHDAICPHAWYHGLVSDFRRCVLTALVEVCYLMGTWAGF